MNLYDLPKDMLVKLVATIRDDTLKDVRKRDDKLYSLSCEELNHLTSFDRTELKSNMADQFAYGQITYLNNDPINIDEVLKDFKDELALHWCRDMSSAIAVKHHYIRMGYNVVIVFHQPDNDFLVIADLVRKPTQVENFNQK